ncbi:MAG: TonB-dependent receptor [Chitinophagaceae bacterium]|nr:TonB-dependent receptor [Chitinophagaceae bacterium]
MRLVFIIAFLTSLLNVNAQTGKVEGKITDSKTGNPIAGVNVILNGTKSGAASNNDGYFVLTLTAGKKYAITLTSVNYKTKLIEDIAVVANDVNHLDIVLESASKTETEIIVKSSSSKRLETSAALIAYQKNTAVVAQVISAEAIRRSPDKNTGEVLKRAPGTSVQDGKYLVVRGLADRYNQAMLNGILLSSTEPDRKTFSFDLFPAAVIDNIIVNKTFIPELPGEWAGGLVQVNTKDIPSKGFLSVQFGTGFNSQTLGNSFFSYKGGKYDWLGVDDKTRKLPSETFPVKSKFQVLSQDEKNAYAAQFSNTWTATEGNAGLNASVLINGGFKTKLFGKDAGGLISISYNKSNKNLAFQNKFYSINGTNADVNFDYQNNKYSQDVLVGGLATFAIQLNNYNKISIKNLFNINATDYTTIRTGKDFESDPILGENIRAKEMAFKSNIYNNTQIIGDHNFAKINAKFKWYGGFGILDQYIPDQRRIQYNQSVATANQPYLALISNSLSQKTGSRFFSNLNDYIYTVGADVSKTFRWLSNFQTIKGGYLFQVKDRLFDSRPFSFYLASDNPALRALDENTIFSPANIGGANNKFSFDEIAGNRFRYIANSILNAGYIQFDNLFSNKIRVVWGARVEHFDQVVGSMKQDDPRHVYSKVLDILPGVNFTYKVNSKTNIRFAASQTVIRPEFREISSFAFFDFELGATILGNPNLSRTKISNIDLRYELYPTAGELITLGVFYKYFKKPIELYFNQSGVGTSSTFNYLNAEKAIGYGIELELRKKLSFISALKNATVYSNISYIRNEVKDNTANINRPMQGQSPYVINIGLQYDVEKIGLNTTLLFNQIGRRILYVGNEQVPAIWENPRPLVDFQIAKKILKDKGEVKLNISDLLNKPAYFYHDLDNNKNFKSATDAVAIKRNYGTTFSISFGYNIK